MRYFFLIFSFFITALLVTIHTNPVYDLTVMRSPVTMDGDGKFKIVNSKPQNIWYISLTNLPDSSDNICVEWDFGTEKKQECIDNDGDIGKQRFTFPVLSNAVNQASFRISGNYQVDPNDIVVYSMDTRPSGSRFVFTFPNTRAENGVISRAEWGADETMRYTDSVYWKTKWPAYLKYVREPKTQEQLDSLKLEDDRLSFIRGNFESNAITTSLVRTENGHQLAWPIQKVKQISRIVLHHTAESMDSNKDDKEMIRGIYVYHTLSREWGDIGYNYLVGQRGQIYEGRAGGDYVVASHAAYNNMGTVGISVLGDYNKNHLNRDQIAGIRQAITMMTSKYGITLSDIKKGVKKCSIDGCYPLELVTTKSLLGHQDIGHTDCPGSGIYTYIPNFLTQLNQQYSPILNPVNGTIESLPMDQIMNRTLKVTPVPNIILPAMRPPVLKVNMPKPIRYTGPKFRVKLSYPDTENLMLATADGKIGKIVLDKKKIPMQISQKISIGIAPNNMLSLKVGEKLYTGGELRFSHSIIRIDSWDRVPDWDKLNKYNDNLFRDTIRVINQNGKLIVINDLPVEWYLKGLGEVSDSDLSEKIKVITVAGRSYARYYMDSRNRKFATNLYDGSDDPDEFQKYLGYSYEMRSPNVAKLVDATRNQVVIYSGAIVKAWYHSSSDGRTLSALEYCQKNRPEKCSDIPYLQSVVDPGSVGHTRSGHGVGISGIGATYWANSGWDYKKIIRYYMAGVEIQRK